MEELIRMRRDRERETGGKMEEVRRMRREREREEGEDGRGEKNEER